jgi:hypothetical protein
VCLSYPTLQSDELGLQKKLRTEVIQLEDTLAQVRKEYEMLRIEFEQNLAANEQAGTSWDLDRSGPQRGTGPTHPWRLARCNKLSSFLFSEPQAATGDRYITCLTESLRDEKLGRHRQTELLWPLYEDLFYKDLLCNPVSQTPFCILGFCQ